MKKYKLLKDLAGIPAGTIGEFDGINFEFKNKNIWVFNENEISAHPDFFEEINHQL